MLRWRQFTQNGPEPPRSTMTPLPAPRRLCRPWLLVGLLLLAGCSTLPLFYKRGPTLAYWWLDSYLELAPAQKATTRAALRDWFAWHRATQLVRYADAIAGLRASAQQSLTADGLCRVNVAIRSAFHDGLTHGLPAFATLSVSLSSGQRTRLAERYAESNTELREEELAGTPAEQRKRTAEEAIDAAQDLYGRLSREQKAMLEQRIRTSPYDAARWLAEREARQQDTLAALAEIAALPHAGREQAAREILATLSASFLRSPREAYRDYQATLTRYNCRLIAEVHAHTTPQQRSRALRKLAGWEADLRGLMTVARPIGVTDTP